MKVGNGATDGEGEGEGGWAAGMPIDDAAAGASTTPLHDRSCRRPSQLLILGTLLQYFPPRTYSVSTTRPTPRPPPSHTTRSVPPRHFPGQRPWPRPRSSALPLGGRGPKDSLLGGNGRRPRRRKTARLSRADRAPRDSGRSITAVIAVRSGGCRDGQLIDRRTGMCADGRLGRPAVRLVDSHRCGGRCKQRGQDVCDLLPDPPRAKTPLVDAPGFQERQLNGSRAARHLKRRRPTRASVVSLSGSGALQDCLCLDRRREPRHFEARFFAVLKKISERRRKRRAPPTPLPRWMHGPRQDRLREVGPLETTAHSARQHSSHRASECPSGEEARVAEEV